MTLFFDSDVILDLLLDRSPFADATEQLFQLVSDQSLMAVTSPVCMANIYYILNDINKLKNAREALKAIRRYIHIIPIDEDIVDRSLGLVKADFEDSLQYFSAQKFGVDFIITRNDHDYKSCGSNILTPKQAIKLLRARV